MAVDGGVLSLSCPKSLLRQHWPALPHANPHLRLHVPTPPRPPESESGRTDGRSDGRKDEPLQPARQPACHLGRPLPRSGAGLQSQQQSPASPTHRPRLPRLPFLIGHPHRAPTVPLAGLLARKLAPPLPSLGLPRWGIHGCRLRQGLRAFQGRQGSALNPDSPSTWGPLPGSQPAPCLCRPAGHLCPPLVEAWVLGPGRWAAPGKG